MDTNTISFECPSSENFPEFRNLSIETNITESCNANFSTEESLLRHSAEITAAFVTAYTFVFIIGLIGNLFVISAIIRLPSMRTTMNLFIANLAFADLLAVIFCLPFTLIGNIFVPWTMGWLTCKMITFLQGTSVSASVNSLVAISVHRFFVICFPFKCTLSTKKTIGIIIFIWLFGVIVASPWLFSFTLVPINSTTPETMICTDVWPMKEMGKYYFLIVNFGLAYLLPLLIICTCYIGIWIKVSRRRIPGRNGEHKSDADTQRSKLKMEKMMVGIILLFMLSWLPLYIVFTVVQFGGKIERNSVKESILFIIIPIAQWLGISNSSINPIIYAFTKQFRYSYKMIIRSKACCGTLQIENHKPNNLMHITALKSSRKRTTYATTAEV